MKKSGAILGLLVISILLISSISFASASWLNDFWNKITGFQVEENITSEPEPTPEPEPEPEPTPETEPECPSIPTRQLCSDQKTLCPKETDEQGCPTWNCNACEIPPEDVCPPLPISMWCPDCNLEKYGNGCLCPIKEDEEGCAVWDCDACKAIPEECQEGKTKPYICEDGVEVPWCVCEDNKWVCIISPKNACPEPDGEPETCAAEIKVKITPDKEVYYYGDSIEVVIEIFDSQGNHLPHYPFYFQTYTYPDGIWHTPEKHETDKDGYKIFEAIIEKDRMALGKSKHKIYTPEVGKCDSVEDTMETEIRKKEKEPEPCGIGKCVPEPECKDKTRMCGGECPPCPEEENKTRMFYLCRGCELNDKCYQYGFRKEGKYCSDEDDKFVMQKKEDSFCDNNFECKTNLCIDGECISSSLWRKIISWFKKLFPEPPKPKPEKLCSKLLIEKNIGDYEYRDSAHGPNKDSQAPLFSDDGEPIRVIKCCVARYTNQEGIDYVALVCPYENKQGIVNLIKWGGEGIGDLGEYKDEKIYKGMEGQVVIIWTHDNYAIAVGTGPGIDFPLPEAIVDAYLKKYPNDLD